jgi:hypothetical protein
MRHVGRTLISGLAILACLVIAAPALASISSSTAPAITSGASSSTIGNGPFRPSVLAVMLFDGALSQIELGAL